MMIELHSKHPKTGDVSLVYIEASMIQWLAPAKVESEIAGAKGSSLTTDGTAIGLQGWSFVVTEKVEEVLEKIPEDGSLRCIDCPGPGSR